MPKYRFQPKAQADIEGIWKDFRQTWGVQPAQDYLTGLRDACAKLARSPNLGEPRDDLCKGLRVYPSGKHLIFYLTTDKGIDVVRILHERMDSNYLL